MKTELSDPIFDALRHTVAQEKAQAYVVGGYVRDFYLGRPSKDVDVVVLGDGISLAKAFADNCTDRPDFAWFKNFGTAMVRTSGWEVEFVGARKESYLPESRKPEVAPGTLEDDQNRRDFTINAMAVSLMEPTYGELLDPFQGMDDLKAGIIRTPLEPDITFSDDPLRMMRAIRFASQLKFTIEDQTLDSIGRNVERIRIISAERITDELNKIILSPKPSIGFNLLFDTGLLAIIFPELATMQGVETRGRQAHKDNFYHTLMVLDNICHETNDLWLRWSALLHDIAKPVTKRFIPGEGWTFHGHEDKGSRMVKHIFRKLKLPLNEKMKFVEQMVGLHHRPKALAEEGVTDSAIRRLIVDAGEDIDALFILCRADMTTKSQQKLETYRKNLAMVRTMIDDVTERDALRNWQPPIHGEHIMKAFGIGPGREIGEIKTEIREAILEGRIRNDFEEAWTLMVTIGERLGLQLTNK